MAWFPTFAAAPSAGTAGFSNINLDPGVFQGGLLNVIDGGEGVFFNNGATPAQLDNNGLPASPLTSTQVIGYSLRFNDSQTAAPTVPWIFKWTPTGNAVITFPGLAINVTSSSGVTITGGPTFTLTAGVACRIAFNFTADTTTFPIQIQFLAATYAAGSPKPVLCRASDEAAITAGQYFTPELISLLQGLHLKVIRFMPCINNAAYNNGDNLGQWSYRTPVSGICWSSPRYFPGIYAGNSSGTNFYTVSPGASTPLTNWTDGETLQFNLVNASTLSYTVSGAATAAGLIRLTVNSTTGMSNGQKIYVSEVGGTLEALGVQTITVIDGTHIDLQGTTFVNAYTGGGLISVQTLTVTGKTNGTKMLARWDAAGGQTLTAGLGTAVYNKAMDVVLIRTDAGVFGGMPVEAMADLCNRVNANLWYTLPMMASDGFVTSLTALIRDSLNTALVFYLEYSNETWNFSSSQNPFAGRIGNYLKLAGYKSYTGLRAAMMFSLALTAWTTTRSAATLRRCLMWQGFGDNSSVFYTLNGSDLDPTNNNRLCTYLGGTFSGTCSGAPNYSTAGNRPIDNADVGGYALYTSGPLTGSSGFDAGTYLTPSVIARLQTLATAFSSNASDPTSLATLDDDIRQGVYTTGAISSVSGTTINATAHGRAVNDQVIFYTTGTLPSPLQTGKMYWVVTAATNTFSASATYGGSAISLSGGSGTHTWGWAGNQTLLEFVNTIVQNPGNAAQYSPGWEGIAAGYDAARAGFGKAPLRIELYEGALEAISPTAAQCTAMGVTVGGSGTTAATALAAGLDAYKKSAYGTALSLSLYKQFIGTDAGALTFGVVPHSKTPAWFLLCSPQGSAGRWSLIPSTIGVMPYKTYDGIAAFIGVS